MDLRGLLIILVILVVRCGAQYQVISTVPARCTVVCPPAEGYAVRLGQTLCMCRNDLCQGNSCGSRGCEVKRLPFYGDWPVCGTEATAVPVLNQATPTGTGSTGTGCSEPKITGRCRALMIRYYYDVTTGTCKEFTFGGCDANYNNFNTLAECQQTCMSARPRLPATYVPVTENTNSNVNSNNTNNNNNGQLDVRSPTQAAQFLLNLFQGGK